MKRIFTVTLALASVAPSLAQTAPTAAQLAQVQVQRYTAALGLSSTQQEEALTIFTTEETSEVSIRTSQQTANAALVAAVLADDTSAIATLSATLGGLRGQELQATAAADAAFYSILDQLQQARFGQYLQHGGLSGEQGGGPPQR